MSWKDDFVTKYGKEAYAVLLAQHRAWWRTNPEKIREYHNATNNKAGKFYKKTQLLKSSDIQGERHKIRVKHAHRWREYKKIIAPESQIHHAWRAGTAEYAGVALVEKDQHMHGIIDIIQVLEGEVTFKRE